MDLGMKCPKCQMGFLIKQIIYGGMVFKRKMNIIYFCPMCDFENTKSFKINEDEYQKGIKKPQIKLWKEEKCGTGS